MNRRKTFAEITADNRKRSFIRLKQSAFGWNQIAKIAPAHSSYLAYQAKYAAISQLLRNGQATVNGITLDDAIAGLTFSGGGRLHVQMSHVNPETFEMIHSQIRKWPSRNVAA
jgi:hypothetical protein